MRRRSNRSRSPDRDTVLPPGSMEVMAVATEETALSVERRIRKEAQNSVSSLIRETERLKLALECAGYVEAGALGWCCLRCGADMDPKHFPCDCRAEAAEAELTVAQGRIEQLVEMLQRHWFVLP